MKLLRLLIALVFIVPSAVLAAPLSIWQGLESPRNIQWRHWSQIPFLWCWFQIASTINTTRYVSWLEEHKRYWR